ncbi:MAG: glycoside hydrolase family 5 protein [Treponema sp.]|nr:glycoside hydrolase family 5 protein [Treponema sp.]
MNKKSGIFLLFLVLFVTQGITQGVMLGAQTDPRPRSPQPMSNKTAMQYFRDEGLTLGINLGNSLEAIDNFTNPNRPIAVETAWGNPVITQAYFNGLAQNGIKIVRIPVTWTGHIGPAPNYTVSEAWLRRIAEVVNMANNAGLKAFINVHHDGNIDAGGHGLGGWLNINSVVAGDREISNKFEKLWEQIAAYFRNYGDWLMFQGFNEIHDGKWNASGTPAEYVIINDWNQRFTNAVRRSGGNNAQRYLLYYGYLTSYQIAQPASPFRLPNDTAAGRQIVGFHWYDPFDFAHDTTTHVWPNNSHHGSRAAIDNVLRSFKTKFIDNGIPVIVGENGPARYSNYRNNRGYRASNARVAHTNRLAYVDYLYTKARENEIVLFYWEMGPSTYTVSGDFADFGIINRSTGQPNSPENAEVIRAMVNAVNTARPVSSGGASGAAVQPVGVQGTVSSWQTFNNNASTVRAGIANETINRIRYSVSTLTGNLAAGGYAGAFGVPNNDTLQLLRTMKSFSFTILGDGNNYRVSLPIPNVEDHYGYTFYTTRGQTAVITVNVSELTQGGWGAVRPFDLSTVRGIQFQAESAGNFNLKVWDIRIQQ